jgi:hypothetical protein
MECVSSLLRIEVANASLPPDAVEERETQGDEAILKSSDAHDVQESEPLLQADIEEGENKPEEDEGVAEENLAEAEMEDNPVGEHSIGSQNQT